MKNRPARCAARWKCCLLPALFCVWMATWALSVRAQSAPAGQPDASLQAYQQHLEKLQALVTACRTQRNRYACDPAQVGPDDQVRIAANGTVEQRMVRYDWLRELLERAGKKEELQKKDSAPLLPGLPAVNPPSVDALLAQAGQRLDADLKQAGGTAAQAEAGHAMERASIATILAGRAYRGVSRSSAWERFQEWLENLLANFFGHLALFGARSRWIAYALRVLLLVSLCVGLVWALVRIERRARVRLVPDMQPAPYAPSARDWQLWFADAQGMAARGEWRDAIHFLYWAAISRLESKRMWPADRARTPREYLQLLPQADARRDNLIALTRSFEWTWYGGREAGAQEFDAALKMAAGLGVE